VKSNELIVNLSTRFGGVFRTTEDVNSFAISDTAYGNGRATLSASNPETPLLHCGNFAVPQTKQFGTSLKNLTCGAATEMAKSNSVGLQCLDTIDIVNR
jgi:hypothetical protein